MEKRSNSERCFTGGIGRDVAVRRSAILSGAPAAAAGAADLKKVPPLHAMPAAAEATASRRESGRVPPGTGEEGFRESTESSSPKASRNSVTKKRDDLVGDDMFTTGLSLDGLTIFYTLLTEQ